MLAVLLALLTQAVPALAPADVTRFTVSSPTTLLEIDAGRIKGTPVRLAWGSDGTLFLRWAETDRWGNERAKNYLVRPGGGALAPVNEQPDWVASYWAWKSGFAAPGVPDLRFEVESREQTKLATGSTTEAPGVANPNRSDPTMSQPAKDYASMQKIVTTTVKLKGRLIVEAQNEAVVPGLTFGWAPAPMGVLAYADAKGRLAMVDREGRRLEVAGTRDVILPAWSPDGKRIACLVRQDKKKYLLSVMSVDGQ